MKRFLVCLLAVACLFLTVTPSLRGAETNAPSAVATELKEIVTKIQGKLKDGKKTEADLAENLKEFDALLAKHVAEKTDDVAQVLYMKAMLYLQVLENPAKAEELIQQLKQDFADTRLGKNADKVLESIKKQGEAAKIRSSLVPGAKFPDFEEKDLDGKPLSIANYKGKVVLIDFWATWCGPCVRELPNVLKAYEKYHPKGFEIIGISLDQDETKLKDFIKEKNMPWPQYFDGKGWNSKLGGKYGIQSIPATWLLDGEGKIIDSNLRGEALEAALAKALEKK